MKRFKTLAYPSVEVAAIHKIICRSEEMKKYVDDLKSRIGNSISHISVEVNTCYFFY